MVKLENEGENKRWGEYYFADKRNSKKSWVLELIYTTNQMIPTFNELFDQVNFNKIFKIIFRKHFIFLHFLL